MNPLTVANLKSVALHAATIFLAAFAVSEGASNYSTDKSAVVAAITAGIAAAVSYLTGLIPNADASANRAEAARSAAPPV